MFLSPDILFEYWIEHISFGPRHVMFFLIGYFTGEFQFLQLIALAMLGAGAVD